MAVRALPATYWPPLRWSLVAVGVGLIAWNLWFIAMQFAGSYPSWDWAIFARALSAESPYAPETSFRWSPVAIPFVAGVLALGWPVWVAAHFAALGLLRDWRLIALVLVSYPFWFDVRLGNMMTFVAVIAWLAVNGSRAGTVAFFVLAVLVPRPLMLPVLAWLLWKRPETRIWFAAIFVLHAIAVVATGYADDWVLRLIDTPEGQMTNGGNWWPSAIIGAWWLPIGLALGTWLTMKGRLGLASIAVQPYMLPYYWLMLLLELRGKVNGHAVLLQRRGVQG